MVTYLENLKVFAEELFELTLHLVQQSHGKENYI